MGVWKRWGAGTFTRVDGLNRWDGLGRAVDALRRDSREREAVVQAAKAALAAVLALLGTRWFGASGTDGFGGDPTFLAPYAAVLTVATTVRRSWSGAARQAAMVLIGVLLAFATVRLVPLPAVGLALVVVVGLLVGRWRRLGDDGYWVAITALLLLVNGSAADPRDLVAWVLLSVVGAVVGAAVNTLVFPPLHLQDARDAVGSLGREISGELRWVAGGVNEGWGPADAESWVTKSRGLRTAVHGARHAVWVGRESVRWNPRRRRIAAYDSSLTGPSTVERLDRLSERVVQVAVLLGDLAELGERPPDPALAGLLDQLADAVDALVERSGLIDRTGDEIAGPAAAVRHLRADAEVEPVHVRSTCLVTVRDALDDLTR